MGDIHNISDVALREAQTAAESSGLSTVAWVEAVIFRIARGQGVPVGVYNPTFMPEADEDDQIDWNTIKDPAKIRGAEDCPNDHWTANETKLAIRAVAALERLARASSDQVKTDMLATLFRAVGMQSPPPPMLRELISEGDASRR